MIGLVFLKSNLSIILKVDDVISYTSADVIGKSGSVKGIDLSQADYIIVESTTQEIGQTLTNYVDKRSEVPPSAEERIKQLQDTVADLQAQLSQP